MSRIFRDANGSHRVLIHNIQAGMCEDNEIEEDELKKKGQTVSVFQHYVPIICLHIFTTLNSIRNCTKVRSSKRTIDKLLYP
jgi:hypothetical protein